MVVGRKLLFTLLVEGSAVVVGCCILLLLVSGGGAIVLVSGGGSAGMRSPLLSCTIAGLFFGALCVLHYPSNFDHLFFILGEMLSSDSSLEEGESALILIGGQFISVAAGL